MAHKKTKRGFCKSCDRNITFVLGKRSASHRVINGLTLGVGGLFQIGPWFCSQCDTKSTMLPPKSTKPKKTLKQGETWRCVGDDAPAAELSSTSVGNYIKSDLSLVNRSKRIKRFSQKYRDAVVKKILEGKTTLAQIRSSSDLAEPEILDWIADKFERMERDLEHIRYRVTDLVSFTNEPVFNHESEFDDGIVLDGRTLESSGARN